jgi:SAM-dependent methyltransferase
MEEIEMYYCNCCDSNIFKFRKWGSDAEIYNKHHIIGGERKCLCPKCGSIDCHSWMMYVLQNSKCWYVSGDIRKGVADISMDICDIPLKDNLFDYIIINHVMSYIVDEKKAFDEMKRCLKDNGIIIMSFPVCTDMDTWENKDALRDGTSYEIFGTSDNVRMYGKDYRRHIENFGLSVKTYSPKDILGDGEIEKYNLIADDITILATVQKIG